MCAITSFIIIGMLMAWAGSVRYTTIERIRLSMLSGIITLTIVFRLHKISLKQQGLYLPKCGQ